MRRLGFDEPFIRMWEFYLAYCEGGFRERSIGVAHLVLAKPGYAGRAGGGGRMTRWANFAGYQLVWFAAVCGASRGLDLAGSAGHGRVRGLAACGQRARAADMRLVGAAL